MEEEAEHPCYVNDRMEKSFLVYGRLRCRSNSGRQSLVGFFRIVHEDPNHQIQKIRLQMILAKSGHN